MRVALRVKPGASRPRVGGSHGSALVVAVSARAVEGRATEAALVAVAEALGVRRSAVRLVTGRTSRDKVIEVEATDDAVRSRLEALLRA
jgi:uncharacterized protein